MKRAMAVAAVAAALLLPVGTARADMAPPWTDDPPMAGNQHTPALCEFAQYWTPGCGKRKPTIPDRRPKYIKVHRHDTLWHLAEKWTGSGHNWRRLAKLNHIKGTTIYTGQRLRIR